MPLTKPIKLHPNYEQFERCSIWAKELYFRLRDRADDYALVPADVAYLKPELYPLCKRMRESALTPFVDELCKAGMVRRRHDDHGRTVLHLPGCEQRSKRAMSSDHVTRDEARQEFLPMGSRGDPHPAPPKKEEKEGRKENADAREADGESHLPEANIPTLAEVLAYAEMHNVPEASARSFFDYHEGNSMWLNRYGRMIDWRKKIISWAAADRQKKPNLTHGNKHSSSAPDRNAGTYNEGRNTDALSRKVC